MTAATLERPTIHRATTLEMVARAASAPIAGVVGQVEGVALVYDVIDTHGTTFARGCLDRTIRERVAAGKVRLFVDHGDAPKSGMYDTHLHVGVVREVWDTQLPDGTFGAKFRADIFDTEAGRSAHEYLRAIAATASETGVSIGMQMMPKTTRAIIRGTACERIDEVPLREISITAISSVPGTHVTAVRAETVDALTAHELTQLRALLSGGTSGNAETTRDSDAGASAPDSDATPPDSQPAAPEAARSAPVPFADRLAWSRHAFQRLYPDVTSD